jgi:hypothetical protein
MYAARPPTIATSRAGSTEGYNVRVFGEIAAPQRECVLEQIFIATSEFATAT